VNFAGFAVDLDRAAVLLRDDIVADREPQTGSFSGRLGMPVPLSRARTSTASPRSRVDTWRVGR